MKKIVFLLVALTAASFAQDPNLHIYLAYGQSNMSGQATVTDKDREQDPRFLVLRAANHSTWVMEAITATGPTTVCSA